MPERINLTHHDAIKGDVHWDTTPLKDMVLMKSSGLPTYHLAVVVDDHDMGITHAFRGEEWLSTTPLHILAYQGMGWTPPVIGHLPVVLGTDGKKLSKRHGSNFVSNFADEGYLPEALLNYVTLVGWSPGAGSEQEIFSRDELIQAFSIDHISPSSGIFDYSKLQWMNGVYIRNLSSEEFIARTIPFLEKAGLVVNQERYQAIAPHLIERVKLFTEVPAMVDFLFKRQIERDITAMLKKGVDNVLAISVLSRLISIIETASDFTVATLDAGLRNLANELGLKPTVLFGIVRIAVTGKTVTPPLFESMAALGQRDVIARLHETITQLS
jgi:glutamyl-tRNA synthetase